MSDPAQGPYGLPPTGQPTPLADGDFVPSARVQDVCFDNYDVDPPSALYINVDDIFALTCISPVSSGPVQCNLRILRPNGAIETCQMPQATVAGGGQQTVTRQEREGFLLSAQICAIGNVGANQPTFVMLSVRRGGAGFTNEARLLIADYITNSVGASWPDRPTQRGAAGPGVMFTSSVGNPAAGSDWTFTATAGTRFQITMVFAQLAAANAGTPRVAALQVKNGSGSTLALIDSPNTQAINTTVQYTGYSGAFIGGVAGTHLYWPLPQPLTLDAGWSVGSSTLNINAGDQWSLILLGGIVWVDRV